MSFKTTFKKFWAWLNEYLDSLPEKRAKSDKEYLARLELKTKHVRAKTKLETARLIHEKEKLKTRKLRQSHESSILGGPSIFDR